MPDSLWQNIYWHHNGVDSRNYAGSVLYVGMGSCFLPRTQSPRVTHTVIVEIDPLVIVFNQAKGHVRDEWVVVQHDAWHYVPDTLFDVIVLDIWYGQESQSRMDQLCQRYQPHLAANGRLDFLKTVVVS